MRDLANFEGYRGLYAAQPEERHSLEALGITNQAAYEAAVADLRTAVVTVAGVTVPILTPLANLPDRNTALYNRLSEGANGGPVGDTYYYSHLAREVDGGDALVAAMEPVVRRLVASRGVMAYDCATMSAERTRTEVRQLLSRIGGVACQEIVGMPQHYHYLMLLGKTNSLHGALPLHFSDLHDRAVRDGALPGDGPIEVVGTLNETDLAHVAGYYARQHRLLTQSDATEAGFSPESLHRVLTDPRYAKILYRLTGQVANLTILADARDCPWIDQAYANATCPEQYECGRMLIAIGAISDPDAPRGLTRGTVTMGGRLIAYAGGDVALGIATDDISNGYVPHMSLGLLRHVGLHPQVCNAADTGTRPMAGGALSYAEAQTGGHQLAKSHRASVSAFNGVVFRALLLHPGA